MLTKQETLLGGGYPGREQAGNSGELLCHMAHSFRFYGDRISFLTNHSDSRYFLVASTSLS